MFPGWREALPSFSHEWVSSELFTGTTASCSFKLTREALWLRPPEPSIGYSRMPTLGEFFSEPIFLWLPVRFWRLDLKCISDKCSNTKSLIRAGVHSGLRAVWGLGSRYYIAGETFCSALPASGNMWHTALEILDQLDPLSWSKFPALLMHKVSVTVLVFVSIKT